MTTYSAGIGDIYPLRIGRYDFGLRFEALYRYGNRAETVNRRDGDIAATNDFNDVLVNVGLQLPLGINEPAPEPAAEPVQVVARKSVGEGRSVSCRVVFGGRRTLKKK